MKNYDIVLFDLDGTLTDPGLGITNSVAYALKKYGIYIADRTKLYKFIGPPLADSFMKYYGFSKEESMQAIEYYREYYKVKGIYENEVYEGIEKLLQNLKNNNKKLIVATSKPEVFAKEVLRYFLLDKYFDYIAGAELNESRTAKAEVIEYALKENGITDKSTVVMIGDREHDVIGAKKNGVDSIGVLFGYGDRNELEDAGVTYISETVEDIGRILL